MLWIPIPKYLQQSESHFEDNLRFLGTASVIWFEENDSRYLKVTFFTKFRQTVVIL
jgi:hypothetical protein